MKALQSSLLAAAWLLGFPSSAFGFSTPSSITRSPTFHAASANANDAESTEAIPTNQVVKSVAVTGATGRVGKYVVQELLDRDIESVVALVRSKEKAKKIWGPNPPSKLQIVECDLANEKQVKKALSNVDAAVWCATGFSQSTDWIERLQRLFGLATQQPSIDIVGLPLLAKALPTAKTDFPRVSMCSSAGVTRPQWKEDKKKKLVGAADIPIVRLNPFGILGIKYESEETLRKSGAPYCIVRPSGLNDEKTTPGSRPVISQGDVSVGRIHRQDVARVLVDVLSIPEAVGKTFEVMAVDNYPPPRSLRPVMSRLVSDQTPFSEERIEATYHILQQLLPGEKQAANELAMGQTYEQLDRQETGRLGVRGKENAEAAAPKPTR